MLPLRDALRLASVKVGVRKGRAIMTILSLSLGIVTMLVSAFAADGVVRVGRELFRDSRGGRAFVLEMSLGTSESDTKSLAQAIEEKKEKGAIGGFELRSFKDDGFLVEEMRPTNDAFAASGNVLKTIDPLFVQDYLDSDKTFDDVYGGKIPVIVSKDLAMSVVYGDQQFDFGKKEAYDKWQEARNQFSGKTVHLVRTTQLPAVLTTPDGKSFVTQPDGSQQILEPNEQGMIPAPEFTSEQLMAARLPQEFVVVGFARSSFIDFSSDFISGQSFLIPPWALEKHPELAKSFVPSSYMIEFKDKAARDVFADEAARTPGAAFNILPIMGQYEAFEEFTKFAQRAGLVIGGVLLLLSAISVWTTLAKIVSDSRREIGVFRAVGARKLDILSIFFAYAFLLSTGGYVVGALLALAFAFGASIAWGDTVFYFMAGLSNATVTETPAYIFLSVPWVLAGLAYVVVVLVGFLGALVPGIRASRLDPVAALRD